MDLTQQEPRRPEERLGGYAWLPRLIDKARATAAGTQGDYESPCPMDRDFIKQAGVGVDELLGKIHAGLDDQQIASWLDQRVPRSDAEKQRINDSILGRAA